jgi:hypothetical protein
MNAMHTTVSSLFLVSNPGMLHGCRPALAGLRPAISGVSREAVEVSWAGVSRAEGGGWCCSAGQSAAGVRVVRGKAGAQARRGKQVARCVAGKLRGADEAWRSSAGELEA